MLEFSLESQVCNGQIDTDLNGGDGLTIHGGARAPILRILKHSSRAHMEERPTDPAGIAKSIRTLAAFSRFMAGSDVEWYLSGGIAVDLIKRSAFRRHGDLDIVLPIDQSAKFRKYLLEKRVGSYRRLCTATYYRDDRVTVFRRAFPSLNDFGNHRTLKLFMTPRERLLPVVDLHFVKRSRGMSSILCNREIISLPFPLRGDRTFKIVGETVCCCDLRLMLFMKVDNNPRNFRDARRIAEEISPPEVSRVLKLKGAEGRVIEMPARPPHIDQAASA